MSSAGPFAKFEFYPVCLPYYPPFLKISLAFSAKV
jgi:hypothetical protein